MGASDINAWRRQNSDPVTVEVVLVDGSVRMGKVLVARDKTLRDVFNLQHEQFVEFDCFRQGVTILAKASIRSIRANEVPRTDQLERRLASLESNDPFAVLGIAKNATREQLRAAFIAKARAYHPDRYLREDLPSEILEYINAMARRVNGAYSELSAMFGVEEPAPA